MKLSNKIISVSKGWVTLTAVILFLIFSVTVLPNQSAKAEIYSAEAGSPDLSLFYTTDELYRMADLYGMSGRRAYVQARFTFDLMFPLIYGTFLLTTIAWAAGKLLRKNSRWRILVLIPLLAVIFDLLENTAASVVIGRYPQPSQLAAMVAPFFTLIKWLFVGSSFFLAITLPLLYGFKQLKN